jgi:alkanesulfonate monooxygenase SsuD/methylene tetrahydromethanopterin reductase-like flavin-dependent oxidoreductase (luciferase family)
MSRRDLAHVLAALAELSGGRAGAGVSVAAIDEAIGRHPGDMRTPLNLGDLAADGRVARLDDATWALTDAGLAWIAQDRELSDR